MHIVLLCATRRGQLMLRKLIELSPEAEVTVFSFRETPWEPPFFDDIRQTALDAGCRFFEARQVGSAALESFWTSTPIDLMLVVSWRYMIPAEVYTRPKQGTFVWHDSFLPQYRGFSPTVWAVLNGEDHTGATLFEIAEEVDAGDIVAQQVVPIGPEETISTVMERVTAAYLELLEANLPDLLAGAAPRRPQEHTQATYTCKRLPADNRIDWAAPSETILNLIRAVSHPYPGAYTYLDGKKLRVWSARRGPQRTFVGRIPGRVVQVYPGEGSLILTGDGSVLLEQIQLEDGLVQSAADVLNSPSQTLGTSLP